MTTVTATATRTRKQSPGASWERIFTAFVASIENENYRQRIRRSLRAFQAVSGGKVTTQAVLAFRDHLAGKNTPTTVNQAVNHVRRVIGWAVEQGILDSDPIPADGWPRPLQVPLYMPRVLTDAEERALLDAAEDHRFRTFMRLSLETAGHYHELLALAWKQIGRADLDAASVMYPGTVKHPARRVPISRELAETLNRMQQNSADAGPFTYWAPASIEKRFVKATRLADLEGVKPDDLPRTTICRWIQSGMSLARVSYLCGMDIDRVYEYRKALRLMEGGSR